VADPAALTERQAAWLATLREGLERDTGRSVAEWAEIARACPETKHRARLAWLKAEHGLGQNRASVILDAAFPAAATDASPGDTLWSDPAARAVFEAARTVILTLPDVVVGQRKSFTAFSRNVQFAAMRPAGSGLILGLAVDQSAHPALGPATRASWSERLKAEARIGSAEEVAALAEVVRQAWALS